MQKFKGSLDIVYRQPIIAVITALVAIYWRTDKSLYQYSKKAAIKDKGRGFKPTKGYDGCAT